MSTLASTPIFTIWKHILMFLVHYYDYRALLRTFNFVTHLILPIVHLFFDSKLCVPDIIKFTFQRMQISGPSQVCDHEYNLGIESI